MKEVAIIGRIAGTRWQWHKDRKQYEKFIFIEPRINRDSRTVLEEMAQVEPELSPRVAETPSDLPPRLDAEVASGTGKQGQREDEAVVQP